MLLVGILFVASYQTIMHGQPSSRLGRATIVLTTLFMFGAVAGMFIL